MGFLQLKRQSLGLDLLLALTELLEELLGSNSEAGCRPTVDGIPPSMYSTTACIEQTHRNYGSIMYMESRRVYIINSTLFMDAAHSFSRKGLYAKSLQSFGLTPYVKLFNEADVMKRR